MANEMLWVAHVDERGRCLHLGRYGDGDGGAVDLPVRRIISDAARLGSAGVLLAHNHPSGDATPSNADCRATRTLARAAEALDLTVVDHLVFAQRGQCKSLRRMGLLWGFAADALPGTRPQPGFLEEIRPATAAKLIAYPARPSRHLGNGATACCCGGHRK